MKILGISAFYHDSAAALVEDGDIVAAAQEERFTRKKHDSGFPNNAIGYCLRGRRSVAAGPGSRGVLRQAVSQIRTAARNLSGLCAAGFSLFSDGSSGVGAGKTFPEGLTAAGTSKRSARISMWRNCCSPNTTQSCRERLFPFALRRGGGAHDGWGWRVGNDIACDGPRQPFEIIKEIHFPHSLGLLYSAFTYYTGFKVNSGEYKVMGLAPYGEPKYARPNSG